MARRVRQVPGNQCRCVVKFVRRKTIFYDMPVAVILVSEYPLAPVIVPVSVAIRVSLLWFAPIGHTCDWLDRVTETQAFVFELISGFKFEAMEKTALIDRENCLVTFPMVGDEEQKGNQLPLRISIINHSEE